MADSEIRVGNVSSINYETGMVRVTYKDKDDSVTKEFPVLTNNDEYRMPQVGQNVLVAHLSNGSSRGAVIGTLWNRKHSPVETGKELYRKDLSNVKDAAYIRYSDETGEYLLKAANVHLNGVNGTILDGPKLEISANISMLLETEQMQMDVPEVLLSAGKGGLIKTNVEADVDIQQEKNSLEALIKKFALELIESLDIVIGTDMNVQVEEQAKIFAGTSMEISSSGSLVLADDSYRVTLTEIMKKLEALGE